MINTALKHLIDDYLCHVEKGISLFKDRIGDTPPLFAWKKQEIPKSGKLSDDIEYEFHGIGCFLTFSNCEVNFDFGPDNRSDGFDLWRLTQFVESHEEGYPGYSDIEKLKVDFEEATKRGEVAKLDHPYCNLYFNV